MPAITEPAVESAKCEKISDVLKQDSVSSKLDADALKVETAGESKKEDPKSEEMPEAKTVPVDDGEKKESTTDAADLEKEEAAPDEKKHIPSQPSVETAADTSETKPAEEPKEVQVAETEESPKVEDASKSEPANEDKPEASLVKNGAAENVAAVNGSKTEEPTLVKNADSKTVMDVDSKTSEAASSDSAPAPMESDSTTAESATASSESTTVSAEADSAPDSTSAEPGGASSAEPTPEEIAKMEELRQEGMGHLLRKNYFAAADSFGKVLEIQAPLYGELSEKLAETYFLYGTAMLEYGKTECNVLGEEVAKKDAEEDDDVEEEMEVDGEPAGETSEAKDGETEEMSEAKDGETEETSEAKDGKTEETSKAKDGETEETNKTVNGEDSGDKVAEDAEKTVDGKEEDEESFLVAWEMLELAKTTFTKAKNQKRLADTLMKLGDVGIETGKPEAITEMLQALEMRKSTFPPHHRIIPETHYTIGCAYAFFEIYDEAADQFTESKKCLLQRIESLANSENKDDIDEIEEMKKIIPEIEERIKDMLESKKDASKIKETPIAEGESSSQSAVKPSDDKPVSNISHLIKRKRTVDDVAAERAAKMSRAEEGAVPKPDVAPAKTEEQSAVSAEEPKPTEKPAIVEKAEEAAMEDAKVEKAEEEQKDGEKVDQKVEVAENMEEKSEKSEEKKEAVEKSEEKKEAVEKSEVVEKSETADAAKADESAMTEKSDDKPAENAAAANQDAMDQS